MKVTFEVRPIGQEFDILPGDKFILTITNRMIPKWAAQAGISVPVKEEQWRHEETFAKAQKLTHFAIVRHGGNVGFMLGDASLLELHNV